MIRDCPREHRNEIRDVLIKVDPSDDDIFKFSSVKEENKYRLKGCWVCGRSNKWDCSSLGEHSSEERNLQNWKQNFASYTSFRRLISRIC